MNIIKPVLLALCLYGCGSDDKSKDPKPKVDSPETPTAPEVPCTYDANPDGTARNGWQGDCTQAYIDEYNARLAAEAEARKLATELERVKSELEDLKASLESDESEAATFSVTFSYNVGDESFNQCNVTTGDVKTGTESFDVKEEDFNRLASDELCKVSGPSALTCEIKDNFTMTSDITCTFTTTENGQQTTNYGTVSLKSWTAPDLSAWKQQ